MNIFISRVYETNSFLGGLLVRRKILGACYVKLKVTRCVCMVFESFIYFENMENLLSVFGTNFIRWIMVQNDLFDACNIK